jgi:hypothetical protein
MVTKAGVGAAGERTATARCSEHMGVGLGVSCRVGCAGGPTLSKWKGRSPSLPALFASPGPSGLTGPECTCFSGFDAPSPRPIDLCRPNRCILRPERPDSVCPERRAPGLLNSPLATLAQPNNHIAQHSLPFHSLPFHRRWAPFPYNRYVDTTTSRVLHMPGGV